MSACVACGLTTETGSHCPHHIEFTDKWHIQNRLWCDMIHRGKDPDPHALPAKVEWWTIPAGGYTD